MEFGLIERVSWENRLPEVVENVERSSAYGGKAVVKRLKYQAFYYDTADRPPFSRVSNVR